MRNFRVAIIIAVLACAAPASAARADDDRAADRATITAGEAAWGDSFVSGDTSVAERLLADDFSGTTSSGQRYDKATLITWVRAGPNLAGNVTSVESIRFFGDVAIVEGRDDVVEAGPAGARRQSVWTDIWVRRDRRWWIESAHDTRKGAN